MAAQTGAHRVGNERRLQKQRLAVAKPDAAQEPRSLSAAQPQSGARFGIEVSGQLHIQHASVRLDPLSSHLFGESRQPLQRVDDTGWRDEGAGARPAVNQTPAHQQLDRLAGGHP